MKILIRIKNTIIPLVLTGFLASCASMPKDELAPKGVSAQELENTEISKAETGGQKMAKPADVLGSDEYAKAVKQPSVPTVNQKGHVPAVRANRSESPPIKIKKGSKDDIIQLDYEQVELRQILEDIASALDISMVIDSSISGKVTIRTAVEKPLQHNDLWPLLKLVMADAGITMQKIGNIYMVKKTRTGLPEEIGYAADLKNSRAPGSLQVTPLRYISIDTALTFLRPLVEPEGKIISLPNLNILGIIAAPEQLRRINRALVLADSDPFAHRGMKLFRLKNSKAADVLKDLSSVLKSIEGSAPSYHLISLERINALLVVSPPGRGFDPVERWVDILDAGGDEGGEQVFIYRVKNLDAKSLAATLTSVFKKPSEIPRDLSGDSEQKPDQPFAAANKDAKKKQAANLKKALANKVKSAISNNRRRSSISAGLQVNIVADEDTNSLIVRSQPGDYKQLLQTIAALDKVPLEVMINVVIAQVRLTEDTKFGINWKYTSSDGVDFLGNGLGIPTEFGSSGFLALDATGRLTAALNALASDNDVRVLSRPSILVRNNQEAVIKVGTEEPIITQQTASDTQVTANVSNQTVQYRDTGILLTITPHINDDGIINLTINQELSAVGQPSATLHQPTFTNQELSTSVVVKNGNAIVLGGLIETTRKNTNSGVPLLKDVPLFGRLFSVEENSEVRTELLLMIIPDIIDPQAENQVSMQAFRNRLTEIEIMLKENGL